jgi:hypothetical protein
MPKSKIRSSVGAEGLIDKNVIKFPDEEASSEVSSVREKTAFTSKNLRSCKNDYCIISPRRDACDVMFNSLVEYEQIRNRLHKNGNDDLLRGLGHKVDDREPMGSETTQMHEVNKLCLIAICNGTRTNNTTQASMQNSNLSDSRDVTQDMHPLNLYSARRSQIFSRISYQD